MGVSKNHLGTSFLRESSSHNTVPHKSGCTISPEVLSNVFQNALIRPARHSVGFDVVIRVVSAGKQGSSEIQILRQLATGKHILQPSNHVLPMFQEIDFDDIVFGIFPYVSACVLDIFDTGTAGEMINLILQALEVGSPLLFIGSR